eukprot:CAMPEP_0179332326 /NCGR_PEP_ID=MMETSP0797-20121207/64666_1 /TAXON_ID=47934 /ORGANISM="Dinophysis acuminata, Strain DAEP01" /LENGTH=53 /DNA_ID=CAMNT_0021045171 /DNA_START=84 /DNA_END=242 /DNA_ORIENTATION=+
MSYFGSQAAHRGGTTQTQVYLGRHHQRTSWGLAGGGAAPSPRSAPAGAQRGGT